MDSSRCGRCGGSSSRGGGQQPHFFTVIICSDQYKQILIPVRFARKYGKELSKRALLMILNGGMWEVGVVRSGDEIWLRRSWDKFMKELSIKLGDFLVFRYEGDSRFHVIVFDMSATEIEYPKLSEMHFKIQNDVKEETDVDASKQIPVRSPLRRSWGMRSRLPKSEALGVEEGHDVGMSHKKCKVEMIDEDTEDDASIKILDCPPSRSRKRKEASPARYNRPAGAGDRTRRLVGTIKKRYVKEAVMRKAEAVSSKNPSFMSVMWPTKVSLRFIMRVPSHHGRKYLAKKGLQSFTLQAVGSNKTWITGFTINKQSNSVTITSGWNDFARGNNLKVGDVCVFEMVRDEDNFYLVHIFRDEEY